MVKVTKIQIAFSLALGLLITNVIAAPIKIKGEMKNITTPYIFIYQYFGPELSKIDSVKHTNGSFQTKSKEYSKGFYKIGESEERSIMLILGENDITIKADLDNPQATVIGNSKENKLYQQFTNFNESYNKRISEINQEAKQMGYLQQTNPDQYAQQINLLQRQVDSLNLLQKNQYKEIITGNPGSVMARFVSLFEFPDNLTKENFFKDGELSDPEYTKGEVLSSKINFYFQKFAPSTLEGWKAASQDVLQMATPGSKNKEVVYLTLIQMFLPYDDAFSRGLWKKYNAEYPGSIHAKRVLAKIPKGPPEVGEVAPNIKMTDMNGKVISLSSLKGKVVLIDFWASWCGPCRGENPNVVRIYNEYKDKGFTVFSVSLDTNKDTWIQAIKNDNLSWESHVSDLKGWKSALAAQYGVRAIPQTFLIDKEGKVVAVNLRGEQLESALRELYNK